MNGEEYVQVCRRLTSAVIRGLASVGGVSVPFGVQDRAAEAVIREMAYHVGDLESYAAAANIKTCRPLVSAEDLERINNELRGDREALIVKLGKACEALELISKTAVAVAIEVKS